MKGGLEIKINDMISFVNISSGTNFRARVIERIKGKKFILEVLHSDKPHFIGAKKEIDFEAPHNNDRVKILKIESFEDSLAKYEAAKHFNNCLLAVDSNDRDWFDDSYAQYTLWKSKIKKEEGPKGGKID